MIVPLLISIFWLFLSKYIGVNFLKIEPFYPGMISSFLCFIIIKRGHQWQLRQKKKFLIKRIPIEQITHSENINQGYIVSDKKKVIRVREKGDDYFITIKGTKIGISRFEFEYKIPKSDALELFKNFCEIGLIKKTRHYVEYHGHIWEIDEF